MNRFWKLSEAEVTSMQEEALKDFQDAADERQRTPVPAYIAPVKRWAGGQIEIDAWYWDRP